MHTSRLALARTLSVVFVCLALGGCCGWGQSRVPTQSYAIARDYPTATAEPTATAPADAGSPRARLQVEIAATLGKGNRDVPRLDLVEIKEGTISVRFAADRNILDEFVAFGAKSDIVKILRTISASGLDYNSVHVVCTYALQDRAGNIAEDTVIEATFRRQAIEKVEEWGLFLPEEALTIAESTVVHPAFE